MRRQLLCCAVAVGGALGSLTTAEAAAEEPVAHEVEENDYGKKGTLEVGGSLTAEWTSDLSMVGLTPTVGYFVHDLVEVSLLVGFEYESAKQDDGTRKGTTIGSGLIEPSYHLPMGERLFLFGGLGLGVEYDNTNAAFDLAPRVGLNVELGRAGVFTPAVTVPILIGRDQGNSDNQVGVAAGVELEAGFTTSF